MYATGKQPNLHIHDSEKYFSDPTTDGSSLFPSLADKPSVSLSIIVPAYNEEERCNYIIYLIS